MFPCRILFPVALAALSWAQLGADGKTRGSGADALDAEREGGIAALLSWGDADGDGRLDLAAVSTDGGFQFLTSAGDGRFEDVSARAGLAGIEEAALSAWGDYDGDGRLDLFVGARAGQSRLFHNEGGTFGEVGATSGVVITGAVRSASWFDHDRDGKLDLFVVTQEGSESRSSLFRGRAGGYFERAELPLDGSSVGSGNDGRVDPANGGEVVAPGTRVEQGPLGPATRSDGSAAVRGWQRGGASQGTVALGSPGNGQGLVAGTGVADALADQAKVGARLEGSSTPGLGKLYPLSGNLFVAVGGNVGIGTTTPAAKLHVAGAARITGKLTLAPSSDAALDVSTGSIYKGGALFLHTKGGVANTALGNLALASTTSGARNTAEGYKALLANTTGNDNTASGNQALASNTSGNGNTASGTFALFANTSGGFNTASGYGALYANTTGSSNTAIGDSALLYNTTGASNVATGARVLSHNTAGKYNTASGYSALFSNTIGEGNTASGALALYANSTGSFNTASGYGALYSNTGGSENTASGDSALLFNTTGSGNTAGGARALANNTTGNDNTASGYAALLANTTGKNNLALGVLALRANTVGSGNSACGRRALYSNSAGTNNTAVGNAALFYATGSSNVALGAGAGLYVSSGSANIAIGNYGMPGDNATTRIGSVQTRTFIAGIRGAATGVANAIPVLIDSAGQLGTTFSSRRFKEDIRDMGDATARLLELRPVTFRYKQAQTLPGGQALPPEYGLIAEEVAEIFPDLVVYDDEGQPLTVKYHLMSAMLLNEMKKTRAQHADEIAELRARLAALEERVHSGHGDR